MIMNHWESTISFQGSPHVFNGKGDTCVYCLYVYIYIYIYIYSVQGFGCNCSTREVLPPRVGQSLTLAGRVTVPAGAAIAAAFGALCI